MSEVGWRIGTWGHCCPIQYSVSVVVGVGKGSSEAREGKAALPICHCPSTRPFRSQD
jgi:hypothetical protein